LLLLNIWDLLRAHIPKKSSATNKALTAVLHHAINLHLTIASELLERKVLPHVEARDALSMAVQTRSSVDVNLKLFDILGRISLTGLWVYWFAERDLDMKRKEAALAHVAQFATLGFQLIDKNRALFLPLEDQQAIEISLFLILVGTIQGNRNDARAWLQEMAELLALAVQTHGRYPCVYTGYRDLVAHPREKSDLYRKEATSGSILIPLIAAFLTALSGQRSLETLTELKTKELEHCTLQLWMPDESSEEGIYVGTHDHGIALCDLPLSATGEELLKTVKSACDASNDFDRLSAIATGFWPIVLTACRHHRLPIPPQFWINMVQATPRS
jgi:hypothetical protein